MAIFSFRPPPPGAPPRRGGDVPADWAETMPSLFLDDGEPPARPAFVTDASAAQPQPTGPDPAGQELEPLALDLDTRLPMAAPVLSTAGPTASRRPDPGFAMSLTARPHNDDGPGAGWYLSSWDLMQGCEVIEGTPIDLLPPEWQRKRPRY